MSKNRINNPLGRGLADLFADKANLIESAISNGNKERNADENNELLYIDITSIKACSNQMRQSFNHELLNELAESIKQNGIIQPLIVKQKNSQGYYELIAGERRWRASILVGLKKIPVIIKDINKRDAFLFSIIENLQRVNLSIMEEAEIYRKLINESYNQEQIANMINKTRSYVANILRLNLLPDSVKKMINQKLFSTQHAWALLTSNNPEKIANEIIEKKLTLGQTEELIKEINNKALHIISRKDNKEVIIDKAIDIKKIEPNIEKVTPIDAIDSNDEELRELKNLLETSLKTKVKLTKNQIILNYNDLRDLDRLIELLMK